MGAPLLAEGKAVGVLVVQSYTREHQYTEDDLDLLAFVAQHVGAALSRARAIEETRQRNAELALINSVQSALAGELELQAIYDVVGDKIQEVFDAQVVDIAIYDEASGLIHFPYIIERGVRFPDEPMELIGFRKHVMETREPLMIPENAPEMPNATATRRARGRAGALGALRPADRRRPRDRRHLAAEPRPRARLHRGRPAAADRRSPAASASPSTTPASSTRPGSGTPSSR